MAGSATGSSSKVYPNRLICDAIGHNDRDQALLMVRIRAPASAYRGDESGD